jgi:AMP deaminase
MYILPFDMELTQAAEPITPVPSLRDYYRDLDSIITAASDGESKSFAYKRLQYLDGKWNLYILLNERQEMLDSKVHYPLWTILTGREFLIGITTMLGK